VIRSSAHRYELRRVLGHGGTARTYEASTEDGELVVVKQLRLDALSSWKAIELLQREAGVLLRMSHPRIPRYIDSFAIDAEGAPIAQFTNDFAPADPTLPDAVEAAPAAFFLVQSKVDGLSIHDCVARDGLFSAARAEALLRDVAGVIDYLHSQRPPIVHRDLTPKNILIDAAGSAYLVDFGAVHDRIRREASVASTSVGTVGYAPLEQWVGVARPGTDLYTLAMTVLFAMTGCDPSRLPFDERRGCVDVDRAIGHAPWPLRRALRSMLEPRASKRAASIRDVVATLDTQPRSKNVWIAAALVACAGPALATSALLSSQARSTGVERNPPSAQAGIPEQAWFNAVRPHCNPVEVDVALKTNPAPATGDGYGYAAACLTLAGKIDEADRELARAAPVDRGRAIFIVFNVIHPVADQGDDRAAGPAMSMILRYWPENYMAMYHAGMAEYANHDGASARRHLSQFLGAYSKPDGFRSAAQHVLAALDEQADRDCDSVLATDPEGRRIMRKCGAGRARE